MRSVCCSEIEVRDERGEAPPGSTAAMVLDAAAPWSIGTHALFPEHARSRAADLMRVGQLIARRDPTRCGEEQALVDIWIEYVMPSAVSRSE